jgi:hypothetical protein
MGAAGEAMSNIIPFRDPDATLEGAERKKAIRSTGRRPRRLRRRRGRQGLQLSAPAVRLREAEHRGRFAAARRRFPARAAED